MADAILSCLSDIMLKFSLFAKVFFNCLKNHFQELSFSESATQKASGKIFPWASWVTAVRRVPWNFDFRKVPSTTMIGMQ